MVVVVFPEGGKGRITTYSSSRLRGAKAGLLMTHRNGFKGCFPSGGILEQFYVVVASPTNCQLELKVAKGYGLVYLRRRSEWAFGVGARRSCNAVDVVEGLEGARPPPTTQRHEAVPLYSLERSRSSSTIPRP